MNSDFFQSTEQLTNIGLWKLLFGLFIVLFGAFVAVEIRIGNDEDDP